MSKKKDKKGVPFDEWVKNSKTPHGFAWESWSRRSREEIAKAIALNDASNSGAVITVVGMIERLRDEHGIATSSPTLYRYCRVVLGRGSWKEKE